MSTQAVRVPAHRADPAAPSETSAWHAVEADAALAILDATRTGLAADEAESRLSRYGPNTLPRKAPPTLLEILLRQFKSPLIYLLGVAALLLALVG